MTYKKIQGITYIEVLVSLFIVSVSLQSFSVLNHQTQAWQYEIYQRTTALNLLDYIITGLATDTSAQQCYPLHPIEIGADVESRQISYGCPPEVKPGSAQALDDYIAHWHSMLQGYTSEDTMFVRLAKGRVCIDYDVSIGYQISVVWRGFATTEPNKVSCGGNIDHRYRRVVTALVVLSR